MIGARRSVVIVDDNPDDRIEVRRMLRVGTEVFHHIREAETGAECLASCGTAPMMMVNEAYHENLTPAAVDALLEDLAK